MFFRWSNLNDDAEVVELINLDDRQPLIDALVLLRQRQPDKMLELHVLAPSKRAGTWIPAHKTHLVNGLVQNRQRSMRTDGLIAEAITVVQDDLSDLDITLLTEPVRVWGTADYDEEAVRAYAMRTPRAMLLDDLRRNIRMALDEDLLPDDLHELRGYAKQAGLLNDWNRLAGEITRDQVIRLRVTPSERSTITTAAQDAGHTISEYIRGKVL